MKDGKTKRNQIRVIFVFKASKCNEIFLICMCVLQNPEKRLSHGQIAGYQFTISQIYSETVKPWSSTVEPASHNALPKEVTGILGYSEADLRLLKVRNEIGKRTITVVDGKLLKNESYLVEVKAGTEKGFSEAVSTMVIPSWNKGKILFITFTIFIRKAFLNQKSYC